MQNPSRPSDTVFVGTQRRPHHRGRNVRRITVKFRPIKTQWRSNKGVFRRKKGDSRPLPDTPGGLFRTRVQEFPRPTRHPRVPILFPLRPAVSVRVFPSGNAEDEPRFPAQPGTGRGRTGQIEAKHFKHMSPARDTDPEGGKRPVIQIGTVRPHGKRNAVQKRFKPGIGGKMDCQKRLFLLRRPFIPEFGRVRPASGIPARKPDPGGLLQCIVKFLIPVPGVRSLYLNPFDPVHFLSPGPSFSG